MEFPVEIILAIAWVVIALLRKRSRAGRAAPGVSSPSEAPARPSQNEALENLLRQFGLELPDPDPAPDPAPVEAPAEASFPGGFQHERHGFGQENPFSEETFEKRPAFAPRKPAPAVSSFDPHALKRHTDPPPRRSRWAERLASPDVARDAFVLAEILERRGGRHGTRR